jgi:hypothetical protein
MEAQARSPTATDEQAYYSSVEFHTVVSLPYSTKPLCTTLLRMEQVLVVPNRQIQVVTSVPILFLDNG